MCGRCRLRAAQTTSLGSCAGSPRTTRREDFPALRTRSGPSARSSEPRSVGMTPRPAWARGCRRCVTASAPTCDLDWPMIVGRAPFPLPIHLGHECVAEVVEGPEGFASGDRVVVPFQISCGTCERCRRGLTGNCSTVPPRSMYGFGQFGGEWGGMLSDLALVPYAD